MQYVYVYPSKDESVLGQWGEKSLRSCWFNQQSNLTVVKKISSQNLLTSLTGILRYAANTREKCLLLHEMHFLISSITLCCENLSLFHRKWGSNKQIFDIRVYPTAPDQWGQTRAPLCQANIPQSQSGQQPSTSFPLWGSVHLNLQHCTPRYSYCNKYFCIPNSACWINMWSTSYVKMIVLSCACADTDNKVIKPSVKANTNKMWNSPIHGPSHSLALLLNSWQLFYFMGCFSAEKSQIVYTAKMQKTLFTHTSNFFAEKSFRKPHSMDMDFIE